METTSVGEQVVQGQAPFKAVMFECVFGAKENPQIKRPGAT